MVHGGLRRTPGQAVGPGGVLSILDHIQVEAAQVVGTEVMQLLVDLVKLISVITLRQFLLHHSRAIHRPAIQRQHVIKCQRIANRVEAIEIRQQETRGIADATIGIRGAFENFVTDRELAAIVCSGHPQAQYVGAQVIHHILGGDDITDGLGHLATIAVHGKTVGKHSLVRSAAIDGNACQQGGLKPAAVLVGSLQVNIRRDL